MGHDELEFIINSINIPLQHAISGQAEMRKELDALKQRQTISEERQRDMSEDMSNIKERIEQMEKKIIASQQSGLRKTIALQATILLLIVGAFISYIVPLIAQSWGR